MAPIGYLNDRRTKRIVIDRERAPVLRELFERYATGSDTLEDGRAFLFSRGIGCRANRAKPLPCVTVAKILSNPLYCGSFRWKGEVHHGVHEPIISNELFHRAQSIRDVRRRRGGQMKPLKPIAYRGVLACGCCASGITAEIQKGHTYYRCSRKKRRVERCAEPYIREEMLDSQISSLLKPYNLRPEWADEMLARIEAERTIAAKTAATLVDENCRKICTVNASLITLQDGLVDGLFDHEYVRSKRDELIATRREIEAKNAALGANTTAWLEPFREWVLTARNIGQTASRGTKDARALLARNIFGSNLVLTSRKARGEAVKPWAFLAVNEFNLTIVPLYEAARTWFQGRLAPDDSTGSMLPAGIEPAP